MKAPSSHDKGIGPMQSHNAWVVGAALVLLACSPKDGEAQPDTWTDAGVPTIGDTRGPTPLPADAGSMDDALESAPPSDAPAVADVLEAGQTSPYQACRSYRDCSDGAAVLLCSTDRVCRQACDCAECCPGNQECASGTYNGPPGEAHGTCVTPCSSGPDCDDGQSCVFGVCQF
jgi:hypothetical protein